ncbi:M14 family zinc carboxypeptidase [Actinomadura kijaniata]|uniref:M14 family zinc carboxypeptidase n=1 Tax=Actinomadura kijaniata TaxID=46161 RepID=UPI00083733FF|nr:M14 family zinc carboxypeptidase [Actinomadura kijaniata]
MRPRRTVPLLLVPLALALTAPPALAAPAPARPAAPPPAECSDEPRDLPIWKFVDYREMRRELARIERASRGRVDVQVVGRSNRGRAIHTATVGNGPRVFLVTSEIHGNEKTGTTALLRILKWLGTSDSPEARRVRREITFVAVPKINPDGAELDRRGNDNAWTEVQKDFPQLAGRPPAWNYLDGQLQGDDYAKRPGFDLNRDFNPDLDYRPKAEDVPGAPDRPGWFLNPESQVLRDVYKRLRARKGKVDVYVDLHHQGACVREDVKNRLLDVAVDYPPLPDKFFEPGGKYAPYARTYAKTYSKQLAISAFRGIEDRGYIGARYPHAPTRDLPGQARSSMALIGTGTVLFEVRGQTQTMGHRQAERFTRAVTAGLVRMLGDVSTGRVRRIDPDSFESLPGTKEDAAARAFRHEHDLE